jgi:hypothetical protein
MRKLMSKVSPLPTTRAHSICTFTRSSGAPARASPSRAAAIHCGRCSRATGATGSRVAVAQAGPDHLRQRLRQRLEARARLAQLLDGLAVLGDVDAGADEALELAVGPMFGVPRSSSQRQAPSSRCSRNSIS